MRARRGLIPSSFLVLLLPLILVSCSGGSSAPPQTLTAPLPSPIPAPPTVPAGLIWSTPTGIFRSQTDGSGSVVLDEDHAGIWSVMVSGTNVVYMFPQVPTVVNHEDIWTVTTGGANRHQLVSDTLHETYLQDVIGSWMLYTYRPGQSFAPPPPSLVSLMLDGTAPTTLMAAVGSGELWQSPNYQRQADGRALVEFAGNFFSLLPDGSDQRQLTFYPPYPHLTGPFTVVGVVVGVTNGAAIYTASPIGDATQKLFAVPVLGGAVATLVGSQDYESLGAVVGSRVVYNRCVVGTDVIGQCDLYSVQTDGSGTVALSTHPDNDIVQGVIGTQVIVRRNSGAPTASTVSQRVEELRSLCSPWPIRCTNL